MSEKRKERRIRDPIHDLIIFDAQNDDDQLIWRLINTREFQRLRRIRQLGFSELVFPGATHSRLAHSIGVFNTARELLSVIEKVDPTKIPAERRTACLCAALLHDVGHGPFSHPIFGSRESKAPTTGFKRLTRREKIAPERANRFFCRRPKWQVDSRRLGSAFPPCPPQG
jgi:hypothetical protein